MNLNAVSNHKPAITTVVLFSCCFLTSLGQANSKKSPFSLGASIGVEHDSNISVLELDQSTTRSDNALLVDLDVGYKTKIRNKLKLDTSYSFSQSLHQELSQFDIQTHLFSAGAAYDFGKTDIGVKLYEVSSLLDGNDFLSLSQVTPSISHLLSKRIFLRASHSAADKTFDTRPDRDASSTSTAGNIYYFFDGAKFYLSLGYKVKEEDAQSAAFDYESDTIKVQIVKSVVEQGKKIKLKLAWSLENREYSDPSSLGTMNTGNTVREDERRKTSFEIEYPLGKRTYTRVKYEYSNYASPLPSADYNQHLLDFRIGIDF